MGQWGDFLNGDRVRPAIEKIQISEIVLSFRLLNVYIIPVKCFVILGSRQTQLYHTANSKTSHVSAKYWYIPDHLLSSLERLLPVNIVPDHKLSLVT